MRVLDFPEVNTLDGIVLNHLQRLLVQVLCRWLDVHLKLLGLGDQSEVYSFRNRARLQRSQRSLVGW